MKEVQGELDANTGLSNRQPCAETHVTASAVIHMTQVTLPTVVQDVRKQTNQSVLKFEKHGITLWPKVQTHCCHVTNPVTCAVHKQLTL